MLDTKTAQTFASEWIEAWNSHDVERICAHYRDDVVLSSPTAARRRPESGGTLRDLAEVRSYFAEGLAALPDLRFDLLGVYTGVDGLTLHYRNHLGWEVTETMLLDDGGMVARAIVHYRGMDR